MSGISSDDFKAVMGSFCAGVTVVTTVDGEGKKWGITVSAFSSLSMDPPLCLVCIDKRAGSLGALTEAKKFAVNVLSDKQDGVSNNFASRKDDKFADIEHTRRADLVLVVPDRAADRAASAGGRVAKVGGQNRLTGRRDR